MSDYIVFVSAGIFIVYMARQNRWVGALRALDGTYRIAPTT